MNAERPGPANEWIWLPLSTTWTDHDGDEVYGDYEVAAQPPTTYTELRSFEPGVGRVSPWASSGARAEYYHGDLIGTTRAVSDRLGGELSSAVYSAFGEPIDSPAVDDLNRYNYAGAWGYTAFAGSPSTSMPFLHVGARWYDPGSGRWMQRDPIGIAGELNVFAYARLSPHFNTDADGLAVDPGFVGELAGKVGDLWPKNTRLPNGQFGGAPWARRMLKGFGRRFGVLGACVGAWETGWYVGSKIVEYTPIEDMIAENIVYGPTPPYIPPPGGGVVWCFPYGTRVLTESGLVAIEELAPGDCVVTAQVANGQQRVNAASAISAVIHAHATDFRVISLPGERLVVTPEHRFFVVGQGWVRARDLRVQDRLLNASGSHIAIESVASDELREPVPVANLEIEAFHVYFVGENEVLVHNIKP